MQNKNPARLRERAGCLSSTQMLLESTAQCLPAARLRQQQEQSVMEKS